MKKNLFILALLGSAAGANAQTPNVQGPWTQVNVTNPISPAPGYRIQDINTVSPTVAWALARENTGGSKTEFFFRTLNPAGTEFAFDQITAPGSNTTYDASNIAAVSATTAMVSRYGAQGGGEILRTTNGGTSWTKATATSDFTAGGGFLDFVYMFDANVGVAVGDPVGGYFEIRRTTDGGATWSRIPSQPALIPATGEAALTGSFFGLGNTIWFGGATLDDNRQERVFKSIDRGVTWTVSGATPLTASINSFAFKDQMNGIAFNQKVTGMPAAVSAVNVIRTSDGGATWSAITPVNTNAGSFFTYAIDAVDGRYYSVGQRFPASTPGTSYDFGTSYSTDGVNWTNVNRSQGFFVFDLITGATAGTAAGYAGTATDANGVGGIWKTANANVIAATRDGALQNALSVYPNPSASGVFSVDLGANLKAGALVTVVDALGRQVKSQTLSAATVGAQRFSLDLSGQKTGVYTLQIRTDAGIATQKLVVE